MNIQKNLRGRKNIFLKNYILKKDKNFKRSGAMASFYVALRLQLNTYNKHQGVHMSVFPTNVQNAVIEIL